MAHKYKISTNKTKKRASENNFTNWFSIQNIVTYISLLFICLWIIVLQSSKMLYVPYVVVAIIAALCSILNISSNNNCYKIKDRAFIVSIIFASIFAILVTVANYDIWIGGTYQASSTALYNFNIVNFIVIFFGSLLGALQINIYATSRNALKITNKSKINHPVIIFFISFAIFAIVALLVLLLAKFPGVVCVDSVGQLNQIMADQYTNHHPFFHTMMIKILMDLGYALFNDANMAVAVYSVTLVLIFSAAFAYTISTLNRLRVPIQYLAILLIIYIIIPYNVLYSFSMWKDSIFAAFTIIFTVSIYRTTTNLGNKYLNYAILCISGLGVFLFRSNAFFAFFIFTAASAFLLFKKNKTLLIMIASIFIVGMFMRYPLMTMLNVSQPNLGESLSIPSQQIARTYNTYKDLSDEDAEELNKVIDLQKLQGKYNPYNADNIKNILRDQDPEYFKQHLGQYLTMYLAYGLKHPDTYFSAWMDVIFGYICSGTNYWLFPTEVDADKTVHGIEQTTQSSELNSFYDQWLQSIKAEPLSVLRSIGFFNWILLLISCIAIARKDRALTLCCILHLAIMLSLIVSVPLNSEFRYAYGVIASIPFLLMLALLPKQSISKTTLRK